MPADTTVLSEIRRVFPGGTNSKPRNRSWSRPPIHPADLFAVAGHLLVSSGAYQFIVAPFESAVATGGAFDYIGPTFCLSQIEIAHYVSIGADWAKNSDVAASEITEIWTRLLSQGDTPLVAEYDSAAPIWWKLCHTLLIIADEASCGMGYRSAQKEPSRWANSIVDTFVELQTRRTIVPPPAGWVGPTDDDRHLSRHIACDSIASDAERSVVRVLPKGRTTEIGCSPRTLSHNLALLPPHGHPNAYWHYSSQSRVIREKDVGTELNVLLIPFPYHIPERSFVGLESDDRLAGRRWGRYRIQQRWLHPGEEPGQDHTKWSSPDRRLSFVAFVDALITQAERRTHKPVNAVVLPEYAVDWMTYDTLVRHLRDARPNIEFVVSGVSVDCNTRVGNQVTFSVFQSEGSKRQILTHSRGKHHRWLLEEGQIKRYGLQEDLDPSLLWWEYLKIESRILHVDVFRSGSTLTAVICEDLARVDPGLNLLRNLGPNIVFALLMDGPQLATRWPGTYATSLSDDPGSSVLSLTSFGLIERSNRSNKPGRKPSRVVALWKHSGERAKEIKLRKGDAAVLLSLKCDSAKEITIDGRSNSDATAWLYQEHSGVRLSAREIRDRGWKWIVSPTDELESSSVRIHGLI